MSFTIQKAVRYQVPIKATLIGPSGSGKTNGALRLCKGFGGKTVLVDTENRRGLYYADFFDYQYTPFLPPFTPERFVEVINFAASQGDNIILDSASHEWIGEGGCLSIVDAITASSPSKNSYFAWGKVTPRHALFVESIIRLEKNIVICLRGKDEYVLDQRDGKSVPRKVGVGSQMRDGLEYECTVTFLIDQESHIATVSKDFNDMFKTPGIITEEHGRRLMAWANSGAAKKVEAPVQPPPAAQQPAPGAPAAAPAHLPTTREVNQQLPASPDEVHKGTIANYKQGPAGSTPYFIIALSDGFIGNVVLADMADLANTYFKSKDIVEVTAHKTTKGGYLITKIEAELPF